VESKVLQHTYEAYAGRRRRRRRLHPQKCDKTYVIASFGHIQGENSMMTQET
jgi:hypothetical protein